MPFKPESPCPCGSGRVYGSPFHKEGTVDFRAYYRERGARVERSMHENSQFVRENGAWVYLAAL
jgi:SEC-C motif domain protein